MAAYDLEEQEQLSELKAWWQQYGNIITIAITVAALAAVGYQLWNGYKRNETAKAAMVFTVLQKAVDAKDAKGVRDAAGELLEKYSGTAYAGLGALVSAKVQFDGGDLKTARAQLAWAAENAAGDELRDLARLRLAQVMVSEGAHEEALKALEKAPMVAYVARYDELRGDIYALQHKPGDARKAYESAIARLGEDASAASPANAALREILQVKRDAQGAQQ